MSVRLHSLTVAGRERFYLLSDGDAKRLGATPVVGKTEGPPKAAPKAKPRAKTAK